MATQGTKEGRSEGAVTHKWRTKGREMGQEQEADNGILAGGVVAAETTKGKRKGNMQHAH